MHNYQLETLIAKIKESDHKNCWRYIEKNSKMDIESNKDLCSCAEVFWVQKVLKRIRIW